MSLQSIADRAASLCCANRRALVAPEAILWLMSADLRTLRRSHADFCKRDLIALGWSWTQVGVYLPRALKAIGARS